MYGLLNRLPNWLRAGVVTSVFVALPVFILSLTDWITEVAAWAAGENVAFPDISALRSAAVALVFAAISGGLNAAYRYFQERTNTGTVPVYTTPPQHR
jgi:hypothetical protein